MIDAAGGLLKQPLAGDPPHPDHPVGTTSLWRRAKGAAEQTMTRALSGYSRWRERRKTALALSAMDDWMLKDLGLTRSEPSAFGGDDDIRHWQQTRRWR